MGLVDVNMAEIDRFVLCGNKVLQQLTQTFLCAPEKTLREKNHPLVNMKIFIGLEDLHAELPGLTMLDFFLSVTSTMTRFGTYPVIHTQSTNMVRTAVTRNLQIAKKCCLSKQLNIFCFLVKLHRVYI